MSDETLLGRLPSIVTPTLVAQGAELDLIDNSGHLPQLETPQRLVADVWGFAAGDATAG
jgi:pimeloyl-ACP methyl ester carboxylesterase